MTAAPTVAIVVPAHEDGPTLRRCLAALARLDPPPAETVFVIDGDDDRLRDLVSDVADRVVVQRVQSGPARARNTGADMATADVLLFVDADVELRPDAIGVVRAYFAEHPEVDALIGSYDDDPGEGGVLGQYKNLLNHFMHQRAQVEGWTFWGALGAVRRDVFAMAGGFDEVAYPRPSVEDIELGYRLRAAGYSIHVVKHLQGKHLKQWRLRTLLKSDIADRALPWSELTLRDGFHDDLNISRLQRVKVALAVLGAGGLLVAPWSKPGRRMAGAALVGLTALDAPLLRFFHGRRGLRFTVVAAAWHWFSYVYSAAAFGLAAARVVIRHR